MVNLSLSLLFWIYTVCSVKHLVCPIYVSNKSNISLMACGNGLHNLQSSKWHHFLVTLLSVCDGFVPLQRLHSLKMFVGHSDLCWDVIYTWSIISRVVAHHWEEGLNNSVLFYRHLLLICFQLWLHMKMNPRHVRKLYPSIEGIKSICISREPLVLWCSGMRRGWQI